jgi:succinate dehydrogenase / fumarate reductase flavoprotein subunit
MKIHTKLNDDLPCGTLIRWVELGLIIIYKLQFQVVSLLENQTSQITENRLGASALMQGLADGYFVSSPYYRRLFITRHKMGPILISEFEAAEKGVKEQIEKFMNNNGTHSVDYFHRKLGK